MMAGKRSAKEVLDEWERKMRKTDVEPTIVAQVPAGGYIGEGYSPQNPEMDALLAAEAQRKAAMRNPTMDSIRGAGDMMGQGLQDIYSKVQQGAQGLGQDMMGGAQALGQDASELMKRLTGGAAPQEQQMDMSAAFNDAPPRAGMGAPGAEGLLGAASYSGAPAQGEPDRAASEQVIMQKLMSMSPEERDALVQKLQQQAGGM